MTQGAQHFAAQELGVDRLGQDGHRTGLFGGAHQGLGQVAGIDQAGQLQVGRPQLRDHLEARAAGHVQVEQGGMDRRTGSNFHGLGPRLRLQHFQAEPRQQVRDAQPKRGVVVR